MRANIIYIIRTKRFLYVFAFLPLPLVLCHPSTPLLTFAGVEVGIKNSQERTILVKHFIGFHVRMVYRNILILLECDTIQTVGQAKDTLNDL